MRALSPQKPMKVYCSSASVGQAATWTAADSAGQETVSACAGLASRAAGRARDSRASLARVMNGIVMVSAEWIGKGWKVVGRERGRSLGGLPGWIACDRLG